MTKESIILKLKQTFTIKRILISLISLFFILFFIGGCSTIFIDPRSYIAWFYLCKNDKQILYDKNLYDKLEIQDSYKGVEPIREITDLQSLFATKIKTKAISQKKILGVRRTEYEWYIDNTLVSKGIGYDMTFYRVKFQGDEASGWNWNIQKSNAWCKTKRYFIDISKEN